MTSFDALGSFFVSGGVTAPPPSREGSEGSPCIPPGGMLIARRSSSTDFRCSGGLMRPHRPALGEYDSVVHNGAPSVPPLCRRTRPVPTSSGRGKTETWSDARSTSLLNRSCMAATARCLTCGAIRVATEKRIAPAIRISAKATSSVRRRGRAVTMWLMWTPARSCSWWDSLFLLAKEMTDGLERFHVVANDLDDHSHRCRAQHAPDTPYPAPEQQTDEHGHLVHGRRAAPQTRRRSVGVRGEHTPTNQVASAPSGAWPRALLGVLCRDGVLWLCG